jgi:hypothetical protein
VGGHAFVDPWTREMRDLQDGLAAAIFELRGELGRVNNSTALRPVEQLVLAAGVQTSLEALQAPFDDVTRWLQGA